MPKDAWGEEAHLPDGLRWCDQNDMEGTTCAICDRRWEVSEYNDDHEKWTIVTYDSTESKICPTCTHTRYGGKFTGPVTPPDSIQQARDLLQMARHHRRGGGMAGRYVSRRRGAGAGTTFPGRTVTTIGTMGSVVEALTGDEEE